MRDAGINWAGAALPATAGPARVPAAVLVAGAAARRLRPGRASQCPSPGAAGGDVPWRARPRLRCAPARRPAATSAMNSSWSSLRRRNGNPCSASRRRRLFHRVKERRSRHGRGALCACPRPARQPIGLLPAVSFGRCRDTDAPLQRKSPDCCQPGQEGRWSTLEKG